MEKETFLKTLFLSSYTTSTGKFNKFDATNPILLQIKFFGKNVKVTTLASYFTKVTAPPSFTQLSVIKCINRAH